MTRFIAAFLVLHLSVAGYADAGEKSAGRVVMPAVKIDKGEACVAPTEEMRRDHMKMLIHQRDRTVRQGIREPRFSLKGCIECHADRHTGSVLGKEGFCSSCHAYVSVKIDCFECHSAVRQANSFGVQR